MFYSNSISRDAVTLDPKPPGAMGPRYPTGTVEVRTVSARLARQTTGNGKRHSELGNAMVHGVPR